MGKNSDEWSALAKSIEDFSASILRQAGLESLVCRAGARPEWVIHGREPICLEDGRQCPMLQVGVGTVKRWLSLGLVTEADGWIKAGKQNRFVRTVVLERIAAGQFGRGLDREGKPAARPKLRVV